MDLIDFARYVGALALVLGLVGFAALAAKRFNISGLNIGAKADRRLALVESLMVGPKHKLCLFKRDGVEHLVLIGPNGATLVENGIDAPAISRLHALTDMHIESEAV